MISSPTAVINRGLVEEMLYLPFLTFKEVIENLNIEQFSRKVTLVLPSLRGT